MRRATTRRLRAVAASLQASSQASSQAAPEFVEEEDPDTAPALEHPLAQRPDGAVEEYELERLREREMEAVERRHYRLATQLRDLQEALRPNQLTLEECAPPTLEAQYQFFLRKGFCVLPDAIEPDVLSEIQAAWSRVVEPVQKQWREDTAQCSGVSGISFQHVPDAVAARYSSPPLYRTFFDIPKFLESDDAFLKLIDRPKVVALLERLVGSGGITSDARTPQGSPYNGIASVGGFQARTVPPEDNDEGYISWHRCDTLPHAACAVAELSSAAHAGTNRRRTTGLSRTTA